MGAINVKSKAKDLLKQHSACQEAVTWCDEQTIEESWANCHRGDWMLWIYAKLYPDNIKELALAKGHCANTVSHLMKDERSTKAVDAAIAFGNGEISLKELKIAYTAADAAYAAAADAAYAAAAYTTAAAAYAAAAAAAAYTAAVDAYAYTAAAVDAYAYAAATDATAAATDATAACTDNRLKTAEICRQYLKLT